MSSNTETRMLLERWCHGDEAALEQLIDRNISWIRGYVAKRMGPLLRDQGSPTDYVQDAMVEVLRYGPKFVMSDEAQFRALICKVVENVLRGRHDWFVAQRRDVGKNQAIGSDEVVELDPRRRAATRPSEAMQRHETQEFVRLGIALLSDEDREVLVLRQWEGLAFEEIGEKLGVSANTARMRFQRALPRLAEKVDLLRKGDLASLLIDDGAPDDSTSNPE